MSRKKKSVSLDKIVKHLVERHFNNGIPMVTQPYFNREYAMEDGSTYVFTEEVLENLLATNRVRLVDKFDKFVNLIGVVK